MKTLLAVLSFFLFLFTGEINSQILKQTIRGTITDQESLVPLPGATVIIEGSDPLIGTTTDINGNFQLADVPVL